MTKCLKSLVYLQLSFSSYFCEGFGMADFERCESLWAFLGQFAKTTKEMRPLSSITICHVPDHIISCVL